MYGFPLTYRLGFDRGRCRQKQLMLNPRNLSGLCEIFALPASTLLRATCNIHSTLKHKKDKTILVIFIHTFLNWIDA